MLEEMSRLDREYARRRVSLEIIGEDWDQLRDYAFRHQSSAVSYLRYFVHQGVQKLLKEEKKGGRRGN